MPSIDMPLEQLRQYKPALTRQPDFEPYWKATIAEALDQPANHPQASAARSENGLPQISQITQIENNDDCGGGNDTPFTQARDRRQGSKSQADRAAAMWTAAATTPLSLNAADLNALRIPARTLLRRVRSCGRLQGRANRKRSHSPHPAPCPDEPM